MKKIISIYKIGNEIWNPLIIGILWLVVCILVPNLDFSNSGSILVCCAIISEMYHVRWSYRDLRKSIPSVDEGIFDYWLEKVGEDKRIKDLAIESDHTGELWHPLLTVSRIDRIMKISIIVYLIIGTLTWGYGDNLEQLFSKA